MPVIISPTSGHRCDGYHIPIQSNITHEGNESWARAIQSSSLVAYDLQSKDATLCRSNCPYSNPEEEKKPVNA